LEMVTIISSLVLVLNELTQAYFISFEALHKISWMDDRLADPNLNPCLAVFNGMLSIAQAEARVPSTLAVKASLEDPFWLPSINPINLAKPSTLLSREVVLSAADGKASVEISLMQSYSINQELDRFYYPFDEQKLIIELESPLSRVGVDTAQADRVTFAGCGADSFATIDALPTSSPWTLQGQPTSKLNNNRSCTIEITVSHVPTTFVWQTLLPTTVVSLGSMFAITLDAKNGDTAAARSSVLLVAMLLLVENASTSFKLSYLLWPDLLVMLQLLLLTGGLIETWVVYLIGVSNAHLSDAIDHVMLYSFPVIYAIMMISIISLGIKYFVLAITVPTVGICFLLAAGWWKIMSLTKKRNARLHEIMGRVRLLSWDEPKSIAALKGTPFEFLRTSQLLVSAVAVSFCITLVTDAFSHFDDDKSGTIDSEYIYTSSSCSSYRALKLLSMRMRRQRASKAPRIPVRTTPQK
ncbi:MAG: hypothetical protein SGPRY_014779, partial [Prymnesium sp.]